MSIKRFLARRVEKITGKKCSRCRYNIGGACTHPSDNMFMRCWHGITRPGYAPKPKVVGKVTALECDDNGLTVTVDLAPGDLTPEEKHQLAKIVEGLKEASETARDGGLLED